jgi:ABC-type branched-subunit amino acid transport system substrate-binding protein
LKAALIVPQSGEYKIWGDELVDGVKTAVGELNENGGLQKQKIALSIIDDPCSENLAVSTAQMLALNNDNKPSLVIGPYCSDGFDKIADIYAKAKVFQIVPMPLNKEYASKNYKGLLRVTGIKEQKGIDFFNFYNQHWAGRYTAVVYDPTDTDMKKSAFSVEDQFRRYGKSSLLKSYTFDQDLDSIGEQIRTAGEDIVLLLGKPKRIAKMIRLLQRLDPDITVVTEKYMIGDSFYEYADPTLPSLYFMAMPSLESNPDYTEMMVHLRLKGIEPNGLNLYGYAAVKTWADLVRKTKSVKYDALVRTARNSLSGSLWSNAGTKNSKALRYTFYRYQNGEFVPVD